MYYFLYLFALKIVLDLTLKNLESFPYYVFRMTILKPGFYHIIPCIYTLVHVMFTIVQHQCQHVRQVECFQSIKLNVFGVPKGGLNHVVGVLARGGEVLGLSVS